MNRFLVPLGLLLVAGAGCQEKTVAPPPGCQLTATIDTETWTYQFDTAGRLTHIARHMPGNDLDYAYAYQGNQATIDITYPKAVPNLLRFRYELTLNEQGYVLTALETQYNTLADGTESALLINRHICTYNDQGYLLTHHRESYIYPSTTPASQQVAETTGTQFRYQDGNPVTITYVDKVANKPSSTSSSLNQYGTQLNPLNMSLLLEANSFGYSPERALAPLLGKPARTLVTSSALTGPVSMTTQYTYRTDADGQLVAVSRVSVPALSAPSRFAFDRMCP